MKRYPGFVPAVILFCCLAAVATVAVAADNTSVFRPPDHKVVIQVSTDNPQVQRIALNNAMNLQKRFGVNDVKVEIVAYGPGLSILTNKSEYPKRVTSMVLEGIRFSACHNTMEGIKRRTGHLPVLLKGVKVVPSGVSRIVLLQEQGYTYVRP